MSSLIAAVVLFGNVGSDEMSLPSFKDQYRNALARASSAYKNLRIIETPARGQPGHIHTIDGLVCGDFVKVQSQRFGESDEYCDLLSPKASIRIRRNAAKQEWLLHEFVELTDQKSLHAHRASKTSLLPTAFSRPFATHNDLRLLDIIDGKKYTFGGRASVTPVIERIETIGAQASPKYRVHFTLVDSLRPKKVVAFVDVDPQLCWMITKGRVADTDATVTVEWKIEYGYTINEVPVMKKYTLVTNRKGDPTKSSAQSDQHRSETVINVSLAEACHQVDESQFVTTFYGIQPPVYSDPSAPTPPGVYIGMGGAVCFILGILLIHSARRRAKSVA